MPHLTVWYNTCMYRDRAHATASAIAADLARSIDLKHNVVPGLGVIWNTDDHGSGRGIMIGRPDKRGAFTVVAWAGDPVYQRVFSRTMDDAAMSDIIHSVFQSIS